MVFVEHDLRRVLKCIEVEIWTPPQGEGVTPSTPKKFLEYKRSTTGVEWSISGVGPE